MSKARIGAAGLRAVYWMLPCGLVVAGCAPQGDAGGRVGVYESTHAEERSSGQNLVDLTTFSDKVVEQLASQIAEIPEIQDRPTKAVLALGDIENKTLSTNTNDFE